MSLFTYVTARGLGWTIRVLAMRATVLHRERFEQPGPFVLACTHLSHTEPFILSTLVRRKIDWMARLEFYRHRPVAWLLRGFDSFPVNRCGIPVRAIRSAIHRLDKGRIVGIFPEGGVARGADSCMRGGAFKLGAAVIANRAQVPIVPVIMVGTEVLTRVGPWLPFRRAKIWVMFGQPLPPSPSTMPRRQARLELGERLKQAYMSLYRELCETCKLKDEG